MKIVYFDGYCNLCNRFLDFLIRHDPHGKLKFASLQGRTAKERLPPELLSSLQTMAFEDEDGQVSTHSRGALKALAAVGGIFGVTRSLWLVPAPIRDAVYRMIAKNRYAWFGRGATCRLPTPEERARFLD